MTSATGPAAPAATLFDRVGGFETLERGVAGLFQRMADDARVAALLPGGDAGADAAWQLQLLLTDRMGGPMAYDGPDPAGLRARLGIDAAQASILLDHLLAALAGAGVAPAPLEETRDLLLGLGRESGLGSAVPGGRSAGAGPRPGSLVEGALAAASRAGVADWNLFVIDRELVLVHLDPAARAGVVAAEPELQRAFGLRAADLPGQSVLRFHPAPTRLQGLLADPARLPHEITWGVGRAVWRARLLAVGQGEGLLGFAIAWKDESAVHRAEAAFTRLRAQAEDLPVPVMFPDSTLERWHGNPACEHALERLAPYLPQPVNPLAGVPIALFFPDAEERKTLFADPARLPVKRQLRFGPETVNLLLGAVLDEEQRYLGPQLTWEIVHFTRPEPPAPEPPPAPPAPPAAEAPAPVPATAPPPAAPAASTSVALRREARALEGVAQELLLLTRLLDTVADDAAGQGQAVPAGALPAGEGDAAAHQAEAALALLAAIRELPPGRRQEEATRALERLTGVARQVNLLALDGALLAVQDDAETRASALVQEARTLGEGLAARVRELSRRAEDSAAAMRQGGAAAARLAGLRARLGEPGDAGA